MIEGVSYLGLFGHLASGAEVKGVGVADVNIAGSGSYVGGLMGSNGGTVTNCYCIGTVIGQDYIGGLVGSNGRGGSITTSYSTGAVSGKDYVGWLVGEGGAMYCYSTGAVDGNDCVGGLVGRNWYGTVTHCYSSGSVSGTGWGVGGLVGAGSALHSVWDTETSGLLASAGGVGLTTLEMMDPNMLGLNGFANDPNWVLDAGRDYPRLAWQGTPGGIIPEPIIDWLEGQGTPDRPYRVDLANQLILLGKAPPCGTSILFSVLISTWTPTSLGERSSTGPSSHQPQSFVSRGGLGRLFCHRHSLHRCI